MIKRKSSQHTVGHYLATVVICLLHESITILLGLFFLATGYILLLEIRKVIFLGVTGITILIVGIGFLINSLVNLYMCMFSFSYNQSICRFCHE